MKRIILILISLVTLSAPALAVSGSALAADVFQPCNSSASTTDVCQDATAPSNGNPIIKIIKAAIDILSFIIGIGAAIGIVVSGFRIITAGGNSESIASARSGLAYSLAGLAVAVLAQALVAFVLDNIG